MKIHHILYMAGLSTVMAACTSDETLQQTEGSRVPIGLSYTTQPLVQTRAVAKTTLNDDYIEVGKKVKVRISNHGADNWKEYTYTTGENGALALPTTPKYSESDEDGIPYYPLNAETHVDIKAYYPADAVSSGSSSFSIQTDQTDDGAYTASDLMWAEPLENKEKTTSNQCLVFSHKMAKILVNVEAGTAVSQINSVTLKNIKPTVTFNKGTGVVSALTGDPGDVKIAKDETATSVSGAAVIPEQGIDGQLLAIGVTLNDNTTTGTAYYTVDKTFTAGNVYTINITVSYPEVEAETAITDWTEGGTAVVMPFPGALPGKFTINANGAKVSFSRGNLQATYDGSSWTWAFATNQWDFIGDDGGNKLVKATAPYMSGSGTVDLFDWVGASSTWTGVAQYGITSSNALNATNGFGNVANESLKSDWGTLPIVNGGNLANTGWRTLTGGTDGEWYYIYYTRSASTVNGVTNTRFAKGKVNGYYGMILFPDVYTHPAGVTAPVGINATDATGWNGNNYDASAWSKMESAGAVFLPAAGVRAGSSGQIVDVQVWGHYWSSHPLGTTVSNAAHAYDDDFDANTLATSDIDLGGRNNAHSVRLVRQVE